MQRQGGPPNAEGQASGCSVRSVLVDAVFETRESTIDRPPIASGNWQRRWIVVVARS